MPSKKGIYEELFVSGKDYPDQQAIHPLNPSDYVQALIHHSARQLEEKFRELADQAKHNEIVDLTHEISQILKLEGETPLSLPLSTILYRYDQQSLPFQPDQFLSKIDLISNDQHRMKNFFKSLKFEMSTADGADWMVSFIRMSGLQLLIRPLQEFQARGKRLRILTSLYMNVTEPKALRKLMDFPQVEVKIYDSGQESFHTKAYLFHRDSKLNSIILGSSNISHAALYNGHEWNVRIPDATYLPVYQQAKEKFEAKWEDNRSIPLTEEWITHYERIVREQKQRAAPFIKLDGTSSQQGWGERIAESKGDYDGGMASESEPVISPQPIRPNEMQQKALQALCQTRENGQDKGVIIAATGTGKTYLSALDVHHVQPQRLLFLAHREELLDHAKETFEAVFQRKDLCGKLTGREKELDRRFLFSTVQSLSREEILQSFSPDAFDYIIVDEFHHAQAATYRKVMDYFQPKFLLGLTATPERMDGQDVLRLCNHNVVYEIRLRDALDGQLLAPFHYFGLSDQTVDYDEIPMKNGGLDENKLVQALKTHERVDYVIHMIDTYGYDGERMVGLGFCATVEHARFMSEEFNRRGYHTTVLTGKDTPAHRQEMIARLENDQDPLQMIFTVDIFNEGVDIPKLNLILFLRPTESSTIFIQQLGRGLRKAEGKEFVTILDFIGNYQKSFIVPLALSGEANIKAFDRDSLRVAVQHEFADLPGASYVDLDPISRKQILNKIDQIRMNATDMLKNLYQQFKKDLGRSPEVRDFLYTEQAPSLHFFIHKYHSWVKTKQKMNDLNAFDQQLVEDPYALEVLERLEKMLPLKWPYEMVVLEKAFTQEVVSLEDVLRQLQYRFGIQPERETHEGLIKKGMERLSQTYKKQAWAFGRVDGDQWMVDDAFRKLMGQPGMKEYIKERIEYGIIEYRRTYQPERFLGKGERLIRYQNYTRNDIIFLSGSSAQEGSWREGVASVDNHYFLFINLNKDQSLSEHLHYKDYFMDPSHFHWQSQNQTSHQSNRGQDYIHHKEKGIHIHLLVRKFNKMHGMTLPFTYLGEVDYISSHGDQPMNIKWRLHHPIPEDLFNDFVR
ncbi:superfamily II DNA or RNA helicase [Melghirimyces profundicolus]|uniref:Superfamily II DNA or RNA helicase n=1 Tax=Melghirimyces profundicolus TaxID=1242148 RepID=A0A2T6B162_9BACL|nr:DUF3427 domain-containing protein [Melghirimyces profundicolus]PTX49817.1 superfamily II DNA or RNA helicase [Melghirimyces profundicolus]